MAKPFDPETEADPAQKLSMDERRDHALMEMAGMLPKQRQQPTAPGRGRGRRHVPSEGRPPVPHNSGHLDPQDPPIVTDIQARPVGMSRGQGEQWEQTGGSEGHM